MKKRLLLFAAMFIVAAQLMAQVSINSDGSQPDSSAMLEVKSTAKGFLPPRMTAEQMNNIISPHEGLLVYNISVNSLYWFDGSTWKRFNEFSFTETDPIFGVHPASGITTGNIINWNTAFSWGNHATAGYLKSFTETDPIFGAHPASGITSGNIANWNTAYANRLISATGTAPLTLTLSNNQLSGSIAAANSTTNGYLKSTDWNTFNNKQNSLTFGSVTSGDMSITGNGTVVGGGLNLTITKGNLAETASSVLTIAGGANAVIGTGTTISVKQATTSQSGYLSSADWNTFNNKQSALSFGDLTSSDITVTGGISAVKGIGATLAINKGNLTETVSSVLTISNGSNAVLGNGSSIQVKQANGSQSGFLGSTDWNSFNNKVSSQWTSNGTKLHYNSGNVGIGTTDPNSSAALEVKSTSQGFLPPRMTMAQRDAITSPVDGLMVFCLDCPAPNNLQVYFTGKWYPMAFNRFPYATNVNQTGIGWLGYILTGGYSFNDQDNDLQGVSTFKWYRADNALGLNEVAISGAISQTYTLTTADTTKYIRFAVTPVAQTGASPGDEVKSSGYVGPVTTWGCGASFTINHTAGIVAPVSKTVIYGTVDSIPGELSKCWITSNLGSDHQATAVNDATEPSAGWYWQFNRKQGYKHDGSTLTPTWTITSINESSDWLTANDPCNLELGTQWRIPSYTEWYNVDNAGGWTNWNGPWGSGLKLHGAGDIYYGAGALTYRGSNGLYWSSTQGSSTTAWHLNFASGNSDVYCENKAYGFSVRCLRD